MNRKEFFVLSITVFATVVIWIASDIYHEFLTGRAPKDIPAAPTIKDYQFEEFEQTLRLLENKQE